MRLVEAKRLPLPPIWACRTFRRRSTKEIAKPECDNAGSEQQCACGMRVLSGTEGDGISLTFHLSGCRLRDLGQSLRLLSGRSGESGVQVLFVGHV